MVDKAALEQKLQQIETEFNRAKVSRDAQEAQFQAAEQELLRIQGKYSAVKQLLDEAIASGEATISGDELPVVAEGDPAPAYEPKLEPVDESGIPDEGKFAQGGKHGRG